MRLAEGSILWNLKLLATVWAVLSPVWLETFDKSIARSTLYHLKMVLKEEAKLHNALPHAANTKAPEGQPGRGASLIK